MKIYRPFLLFLLCASLLLSGCEDIARDTETTIPPAAQTTEQPEAEEPAGIYLSQGGKALYQVIYPFSAGDRLFSLSNQTTDRLSEAYGINFKLISDSRKQEDGAAPEILVGKTNRLDPEAFSDRLGYNGYMVRAEGEKIVIYGSTYEAQQAAIETFFGALTQTAEGEVFLALPDEGIVHPGSPAFFANAAPTEYVIVSDAEDENAAKQLQTAIAKQYGYTLPLHTAEEAETAYEILVGTCGRTSAEAVLNEISSAVGARIQTNGEKLFLLGKSGITTTQAVEYFCRNYVENDFATTFQIPQNIDHSFSGLIGADYATLTEGADIRVMSFNLLAEIWNNKTSMPLSERNEIASAALLTYMPDVIGLQEFCDQWRALLIPTLENEYSFVNLTTVEGYTNFTGLAYNTKTLKLITSGCEPYSVGSVYIRLMNWAIFETVSDGKRFAVINTHLEINDTEGEKNASRLIHAAELADKVLALKETYDCPVIITGDYNCSRSTEEYKLFVETAAVKDAQWDSLKKVNNGFRTSHTVGEKSVSADTSIDHITYTAGVESLFYINHNTAPTIYASDHNPIMADVKLN